MVIRTRVLAAVGGAFLLLSIAATTPVLAAIGVFYLAAAWWTRRASASTRWRRRRGTPVAALGLAGAALALGLVYAWLNATPPTPDAFYQPPATVPAKPGTLLRSAPFTRALPPGTRAWRILYTTTRADAVPAVASAIVLAPLGEVTEPLPVVAWAHGTTGAATGCAPTLLPAPFPFDATLPALKRLIAANWVLVATDYIGLGTAGSHPYLVGEPEARSTLDAVRAARQLKELRLDARTVVWGHSQGGHAAWWTGILAPDYAPDVALSGVAALAPATDLGALVDAAQHTTAGKIMASYLMTAYGESYPDVRFDDYVGPRRRAHAMANRCLSGPGALLSVLTSATLETGFFVAPVSSGALATRLAENTPLGLVTAPLLVAQGLTDDLVLPDVQQKFVQARCEDGQSLEYRAYGGRDHLSLVAPDSLLPDDLVQWTQARFAGVPTPSGCRTIAR